MKKRIRRISCILLVVFMVCSLLTGCGGEKKPEKKGDTGERVTLTIGLPQVANITSYEDNALTKYIEESLNIELEFVFFSSSSSEYAQQLTLMAAGNEELPDVLWGFYSLGTTMINSFGEDGYFLDLTELLEEYGVNFNAQLAALDESEREYILEKGKNDVDGCFYSMPLYAMPAQDDMGLMTFINKTWLDKLGLKMPTTLNELYTVLKAFATEDPNGNGEADEIPMLSHSTGKYAIQNYIINAFEYYDNESRYYVENGTVIDAASTEGYRQALIYANKLCKEKLLSDLSFSMTATSEFMSLITPSNNVARVGIWSGHPAVVTDSTSTILDQYVVLPALADETGHGGYDVVREPMLRYGAGMITKDCENVEAAIKLLDFFYADETVARVRHGEKDVDWLDVEGTGEYGQESHIEVVNANAFFKGNSTWGQNGCMVATYDNYFANSSTDKTGRQAEVSRLNSEVWNLMENANVPKETVYRLLYTSEEEETKNELSGAYETYIAEQQALFITGNKNPNSDSEWKEYLATLDTLGRKELLEIKQVAYDRKHK